MFIFCLFFFINLMPNTYLPNVMPKKYRQTALYKGNIKKIKRLSENVMRPNFVSPISNKEKKARSLNAAPNLRKKPEYFSLPLLILRFCLMVKVRRSLFIKSNIFFICVGELGFEPRVALIQSQACYRYTTPHRKGKSMYILPKKAFV